MEFSTEIRKQILTLWQKEWSKFEKGLLLPEVALHDWKVDFYLQQALTVDRMFNDYLHHRKRRSA